MPSSCISSRARYSLSTVIGLVLVAAVAVAPARADDPGELPLVPLPTQTKSLPGSFTLTATTSIQAPPALRAIAELFRDQIRPATGLPLPIKEHAAGPRIAIELDKKLGALGDEGYRLDVTPKQVRVRAGAPAGVFYGLQTLRQLLPTAVFRRSKADGVAWSVPGVEIEDRPRFSWRGSHMDVGRHFMPMETILKHLDLLALHKMNVFHWHLTEDQGWRIEIKKYPRLTEVGAWRKDSVLGPPERDAAKRRFAGRPHGGFYTQDDVREVVRYAGERFITVVPEIEMPGHARAAIAAYPELGNTGKPIDVATSWGIFEEVFNVEDRTLTFLEDVLTEVLALFPSKFIHIGGDEVKKREWQESAVAQARMKALGLKDEHELQSWFIKHFDAWLAARGRRLIGWDEILEGGLAPGAAVMSWRLGEKGGIAGAKSGHDVVMATKKPLYFDKYQAIGPLEPIANGDFNPIEDVYAYDPIPKELTPAEAVHVIGAQAQLWSEYVPTGRQLEYMVWPRMCAVSEVVWTPAAARDFDRFKARLKTHLERLQILDVNLRPLAGPFPTTLTGSP